MFLRALGFKDSGTNLIIEKVDSEKVKAAEWILDK